MPGFFTQLRCAFCAWWREQAQQRGVARTSTFLLRELWEFLRDSTPGRRRQRYGDMDYDWEHRVNTTSGTVGWRERLLGIFYSAYQPTEPSAFAEMMASLPIDFRPFTFVDLGSGKGRTLLMAAEYPFRRIIGVEILLELHRAAEDNVRTYVARAAKVREARVQRARGSFEGARLQACRNDEHASPALAAEEGPQDLKAGWLGTHNGAAEAAPLQNNSGHPVNAFSAQTTSPIECVCADAKEYEFPADPLVLYLFNPVSEAVLTRVIANLERSLREHPRSVYILYHNPLLEHVLAASPLLRKKSGAPQFSIYKNAE